MKVKLLVTLLAIQGALAADSERVGTEIPLGFSQGARLREVPIETHESESTFWQRFSLKSREEFTKRFFYRANPFLFKLHDMSNADPNQSLVNRGYVMTAVKYSARETIVDTSLVQDSQDWLRNFVEGVIGNTEEEEVAIMTEPTLQYSEEAWRKKVKNDNFKWGVRLLRWPNQYAYVSGKIGHHGGQEILQWHLRYYVQEFKEQRVEGLLTMPLPEKFFLSLGLSYSPSQKYWEVGRVYAGTLRVERWWEDVGGFYFTIDASRQQYFATGFFAVF